MATDINSEFDIGPLSWVQVEIDQSLTRGLESLEAFDPASGDDSPLQRARAHFRQAAGAIHMVGLDALQAYTDEIEHQLVRLSNASKPEAANIIVLVARASRKLQEFLAEIVRGASLVPLSLYDEYEAMLRSRDEKIIHPSDLFCPDLSIWRDDGGPQHVIPPAQFQAFLIKERRLYQHGLLAWLRGDIKGAEAMRGAAKNIELAAPQQTVRTFWWTVTALFDAVRKESIANTLLLKQLLARIDLQTRRLIDGSDNVAERLRRETLYFLAISEPASKRIRQVQEHYRLNALLPAGETGDSPTTGTLTALRITREAQGLAAEAKNIWQRLMVGQIDQYPELRNALQTLHDKAAMSVYPEMQSLFAGLLKGCDALTVGGTPEPVAMEYATALLFAEDVFAQQGAPIAGLSENVRAIQARITAVLSNRPLPALDMSALAALSERAQNRLLLAQVSQDIQANLRHMEQELDAFFRDNSKHAGLKRLARDGREISGAFRILGLDNADHLLSACMEQIAHYASATTIPEFKDFELLAESLSALGFYIEALEQQRSQREELILPLLERQQERLQPHLRKTVAAPAAANVDAIQKIASEVKKIPAKKIETKAAPAPSIEATIKRDISRLQVLSQQLRKNPQAGVLQREIKKIVLTLGDDAKLVNDTALADKIKGVREQMAAGAFTEIPSLLSKLIETTAVTAAPSAETQRLMLVDAGELDAELLDIYLQEAIEVLDGVREHHKQLAQHPHDHEALRTVRRAFHTLKGSGRMVGLTELGELAYDVEKIHNRLLEEGYPATPTVLTMIDAAEREFRQWVETLIKAKTVSPDPSKLYATIETVAHELSAAAPLSAPPEAEEIQKKTLIPPLPENAAEIATDTTPETVLDAAPEAEKPETSWDKWDLSPPLSEASTTEEVEVPVAPVAAEKPVAPAKPVKLTSVSQKDDDDVVSFELDISSLKKISGGESRQEKPIAPVKPVEKTTVSQQDDDDVVSLELDMSSLKKTSDSELRQAEPIAPVKPAEETIAHTVQQDDDDVVSLEIDMSSFKKAHGDEPHQANPIAAAERPDGSVSLEIGWAGLKNRHADKKPFIVTPALISEEAPLPPRIVKPSSAMPEATVATTVTAEPSSEITTPTINREEVKVGEIVLSKTLFDLFTQESEQHWSALNHEQDLMRLDASYMPSSAMVRAAHTLAGAHLAVGFPDVAKVAKALELLLLAVGECRKQGGSVTSKTVPVIARAIAGLRLLIDRIRQRQAFAPAELREAEAIEMEIGALQNQISATLAKAEAPPAEKPATIEQTPAPVPMPSPTRVSSVELPMPSAPLQQKPVEESSGDANADLLSLNDEIDAQLLPLFLEEGGELYQQTGKLLRQLRQSPENNELQLELKRNLHTYKGSARMVGAMRLGELAHRMETYLAEGAGSGEAYFEELETNLDRIGYVFDRLRAGDVNVAFPWLTEHDKDKESEESVSVTTETAAAPAVSWQLTGKTMAALSASPAVPVPEEGQLRVSAAKVDRLVNEAGEIIIARTRAEGELRGLKSDLLELTNSVIRLRSHVRGIEIEAESQIQAQLEQMQTIQGDFDPLEFDRYTRLQELTRSIAEGVNDVSTVQQTLLAHLDTANVALLSQARLSRDVQQALFSVRTVPFSNVTERLYRILRTLSKELQKRANLDIKGAHHGLDRAVLERLVGPLEHLLRNSLDHGIEPPEARRAAGKPETGEITITVRQVGNEIVIAFSDDGAGLDPKTLQRIAVEKGLLAKDEVVSDAKLFELILEPGFTTS
ncbi:MAG: Hpt domain-containing protein, partial [Burkholderiales bacterium]|nr:Hpt domain-containing protein [Burkholderiales bacterium]